MLRNYLILSFKVLARRKFFTFVSLFAISFTLLVLLVAVALYDHTLSPNGVERKLDRSLLLSRAKMLGDRSSWHGSPGYGLLDIYTRDLPGIEAMSIFSVGSNATSFLDGEKIVSRTRLCDAEYWRIMDFDFLAGAPFTQEDDRDGRQVAVVTAARRSSAGVSRWAIRSRVQVIISSTKSLPRRPIPLRQR